MTRNRLGAGGFSMVEVMVITAIIGVMAVLGIPSILKILPRIRLNNAVMLLSNEIALTRVRAVAQSTTFRVSFNPAAESYTISKFITGSGFQQVSTSGLTGTDLVSVTGFNPSATVMEVDGVGAVNVPLGSGSAVILTRSTDNMFQKRILVEASGRVRVEKLAPGGGWVED